MVSYYIVNNLVWLLIYFLFLNAYLSKKNNETWGASERQQKHWVTTISCFFIPEIHTQNIQLKFKIIHTFIYNQKTPQNSWNMTWMLKFIFFVYVEIWMSEIWGYKCISYKFLSRIRDRLNQDVYKVPWILEHIIIGGLRDIVHRIWHLLVIFLCRQ